MRLRYKTKRNPVMTGVLAFVSIVALLCVLVFKIDLTGMVFGKIGKPEAPTVSKEQYADILAIRNQQQDTTPEPATAPIQQVIEQETTLPQANEPGVIYQYIDSSGMIVMVDDLEKVPAKYRTKMKTSAGTYGQQRTNVKVQNNQIWVPVTFSYKGEISTALLLLDTGATSTSISPALARRLGIRAAETTRGKASLADGSMVQTAHVVVDRVTVGPKTKRGLNVQIMPRAGDEETGLLGMNFLGEFPHTIETRTEIIRWQ